MQRVHLRDCFLACSQPVSHFNASTAEHTDVCVSPSHDKKSSHSWNITSHFQAYYCDIRNGKISEITQSSAASFKSTHTCHSHIKETHSTHQAFHSGAVCFVRPNIISQLPLHCVFVLGVKFRHGATSAFLFKLKSIFENQVSRRNQSIGAHNVLTASVAERSARYILTVKWNL